MKAIQEDKKNIEKWLSGYHIVVKNIEIKVRLICNIVKFQFGVFIFSVTPGTLFLLRYIAVNIEYVGNKARILTRQTHKQSA